MLKKRKPDYSPMIAYIALLLLSLLLLFSSLTTKAEATTIRQDAYHDVAEALRGFGVQDDHAVIKTLSAAWWQESADVTTLANVAYPEAKGIKSVTEVANVMWTILNRGDAGYASDIDGVVNAANQFAYDPEAPLISQTGIDLYWLAEDVITRWTREKMGETDVGRTLPADYLWYSGDGKHNYFRNAYSGGQRWDYSLTSPYES
ncbi:MAG: hypothetical protein EOM03_14235 [Clostridia bacterium]|nr:hypothetical protein [Clostridia bacterium]